MEMKRKRAVTFKLPPIAIVENAKTKGRRVIWAKKIEAGKNRRVQDTGAKGGPITHVPFGYLRMSVVYFLRTWHLP